MTFTPKDISDHNPNVPKEHPLKEFALLVVTAVVLVVIVFFVVGWLAESLVVRVPVEWEKRLFPLAGLMKEEKDLTPVNQYLSEIVGKLAAREKDKRYEYHVTVKCLTMPNAFAFPGGDIVVTSGLFDSVKSENGLAFVLAHEIGHFAHRDQLKGLGRGLVLLGLTSLIAGESTAARLVNNVTSLFQLKFSRLQEEAADTLAIQLLEDVYGHTGGADEFFSAIRENEGKDRLTPEFFSTHPSDDHRIARLQALKSGTSVPLLPLKAVPSQCQ